MTSRKPMIALTPYYNIEREEPYMRPAYIQAIRHAGGIPVTLSLDYDKKDLEQIAECFDGFLFTGGPDLHPFYFGEQTQLHCGNVCLKRDTMELELLRLAMEKKKSVLGICRGIQLLNIGLGGDIYQDIPSQFPQKFPIAHTQPFYYDIPSHTVDVVPGTLLARIVEAASLQKTPSEPEASPATSGPGDTALRPSCPTPQAPTEAAFAAATEVIPIAGAGNHALTIRVNSMHHQAVRRVAPGAAASGYAPEGLVEAIELPAYPTFFLGVQWHPEYLWSQDPVAEGIFTQFVKAAGEAV